MNENVKHITSAYGTTIGYTVTGSGPGLVIVHGGGRMATDYTRLANALADKYTVYTYDRRGRGMSGKIAADHSLDTECNDLAALIAETGSDHIFGHSMGGFIALEAAARMAIGNVAVYEPPVSVNNSIPTDFVADFKKAVEQGQYEKAMACSMKGLQMHEAASMPIPILVAIIKSIRVLKGEGDAWNKRMAETLPTLITDLDIILQHNNTHDKYRQITSEVLLMGGSKSPAFLLDPLSLLHSIIPKSEKHIFDGLYHVAPEENANEIAQKLKQFFN
jgi:pimeloyl-ACP methyl ester carboxylesterase